MEKLGHEKMGDFVGDSGLHDVSRLDFRINCGSANSRMGNLPNLDQARLMPRQ
jgi:hypothetical protein